ncbi:MAG: protein kinase [Bryobacteraceae bacterium]
MKPGNVLLDKAGRPKISDFGIARGSGDDQLTQVGFFTGTPGYLSPELAVGGDPHPASDVWALGATLYAAVEGQPPYEPNSNPIALLRTIASEQPRPMSHAGTVGPAIDAMMSQDPARRWDMATSASRLGRIARGEATAVMTQVWPQGAPVIAAPPVEGTQSLEATTPLAVRAPVGPSGHPGPAAAPGVPSPPDEGRGGRRWVPVAFVALLLVGLAAAAYLLSPLGDNSGTSAARATNGATAPATTTQPRSTPAATTPVASSPPATSTPTGTDMIRPVRRTSSPS